MLNRSKTRITNLTTLIVSYISRQPFKYPLPQRLIEPEIYMKYVKQNTKIAEVVGEQKLRQLYTQLKLGALKWRQVDRTVRNENGGFVGLYVYETTVLGEQVYLRVNQFPQQPLYTLIYADIDLVHINDFPKHWDRSKSKQQ